MEKERLREKIGFGVRLKDGTPGILAGVDDLITIDFGDHRATYIPDAFEEGLIYFDCSVQIERPAEPDPDPFAVADCEYCGCELTACEEYCPCCGSVNPGAEWIDCPKCGRRYLFHVLKCPKCGERNPLTLDMDDEEYKIRRIFEDARDFWEREDRLADEDEKKIYIPRETTVIGRGEFENCKAPYWGVDLPYGLKRIGPFAFSGCDISEITIPETVVFVGPMAFSSCKNLLFVAVLCPKSVVDPTAFDGCDSLREIYYANED